MTRRGWEDSTSIRRTSTGDTPSGPGPHTLRRVRRLSVEAYCPATWSLSVRWLVESMSGHPSRGHGRIQLVPATGRGDPGSHPAAGITSNEPASGRRSVGAELHGGAVERLVLLVEPHGGRVGRDRGRATGGELADELVRVGTEQALGGIQLELGAGVGDVEVAHRQLADAV